MIVCRSTIVTGIFRAVGTSDMAPDYITVTGVRLHKKCVIAEDFLFLEPAQELIEAALCVSNQRMMVTLLADRWQQQVQQH